MRISDWSSDVCSSDLRSPEVTVSHLVAQGRARSSTTADAEPCSREGNLGLQWSGGADLNLRPLRPEGHSDGYRRPQTDVCVGKRGSAVTRRTPATHLVCDQVVPIDVPQNLRPIATHTCR